MTEVFTAKTVEEAKALAVQKFGKNESEIKFEIINEGKKGFLGIGAVDAQVKATVADAPKPVEAAAPVKEAETVESPAAVEIPEPVILPEEVKAVEEVAPAEAVVEAAAEVVPAV